MPSQFSVMHRNCIYYMTQAMYKWSAELHHEPDLPTTTEETDFYWAYLGGGPL